MSRALNTLVRWLGTLSAWLTFAMVLVTVLIVVLRYALGTGAIALQESVVYAHAIVVALGLAYTLQTDGHVRVDLFYARFSEQTKAWVDLIGHCLFLLPVCIAIAYLSIDYVSASWAILEGSPEVGGLPAIYLLKTLIPVSAVLLVLQGLALIATTVARLRAGSAS